MGCLASNIIETGSLPSTLELVIDCIDFVNEKTGQQQSPKSAAKKSRHELEVR